MKKNRNLKNANQKGFTLVELLVVIAIIGLLSTLAVVSLSAARSRARDAKRLADLTSIQAALELYISDKGKYPSTSADITMNGGCVERDAGVLASGGACTNLLVSVPKDPLADAVSGLSTYDYKYKANNATNGASYAVQFVLEKQAGTTKIVCATPAKLDTDAASTSCTP